MVLMISHTLKWFRKPKNEIANPDIVLIKGEMNKEKE